MTTLITGVSGFTGGHLACFLAGRGERVRGLVRPSSLKKSDYLLSNDVELVQGDLTDRRSLDNACQGVQTVYHVAASYRTAGQSDRVYHEVNVRGTESLLQASVSAGVKRFVHCSTGGVHGHIQNPPANEDAPLAPGDIYQETKLEAESLVRTFSERAQIDTVIVRPIGIYGPGDTRFLKMFRGIYNQTFPILGPGEVFYHLTYIDDLVEGLRLCGTLPAAVGNTYLLAGPSFTTLKELAAVIAAEFGVSPPQLHLPVWPVWLAGALCEAICVPLGLEPPLYRRRVEFFTKSRAFDTTRAQTDLGYTPKVDLKTGIHMTAAWYRAEGWLG